MLVGSIAPNFTAKGLTNGEIEDFSLNNYKGKWVVLFFYSGDFSFV